MYMYTYIYTYIYAYIFTYVYQTYMNICCTYTLYMYKYIKYK